MRRTLPQLVVRIGIVALCVFASWWSLRMARADWLAAAGSAEAIAQAARLEPHDARFAAIDAILRSDNGDLSPEVDGQLLRAFAMNPFDSTVLMTLGLRAEFRGDPALAERYLTRAAEVDHQFKPAWTLANFYVRTNRTERIWPLVSRCLHLDPLGFDAAPVFDLCWNATSDSAKILALIPRGRPRMTEYFSYLVQTRRTDAAIQAWPETLSLADASSAEDRAALTGFAALLVKANRIPEAVRTWNALAKKNIIHSGQLNPPDGVSIADPSFASLSDNSVFSWWTANMPGAFSRDLEPSVQFDFDGTEPEKLSLLQVLAPVVPSRKYRLIWKTDPSRLSAPNDAGFVYRITQDDGSQNISCLLLSPPAPCVFTTGSDVFKVQIELRYERAPGTTRSKGTLRITSTSLEFAS